MSHGWTVTRATMTGGDEINNLWFLWVDGKVVSKVFFYNDYIFFGKIGPIEKGESGRFNIGLLKVDGLFEESVRSAILKLESQFPRKESKLCRTKRQSLNSAQRGAAAKSVKQNSKKSSCPSTSSTGPSKDK